MERIFESSCFRERVLRLLWTAFEKCFSLAAAKFKSSIARKNMRHMSQFFLCVNSPFRHLSGREFFSLSWQTVRVEPQDVNEPCYRSYGLWKSHNDCNVHLCFWRAQDFVVVFVKNFGDSSILAYFDFSAQFLFKRRLTQGNESSSKRNS